MDFDALYSSQNLADMLALPGHTPAAVEPLLQYAVKQNRLLCSMFNVRELGQQFMDFNNESLCLVVAIPDANGLNWKAQLTDWVIPYCEVNHLEQTTRALAMLGDGPIAVPTAALAPLLFGVEKALVVFATQQSTVAAAYRWNEKFLATVEAIDTAAEKYEFDEYQSARAVAIGRPIFGCSDAPALVPMPVTLKADGTVQPHEERELQLLPFSPYNPEYAA